MLENRPTKKQRELLSFIDGFIKGNGYGPSYREVMRALDYKSVSTVATHIDGLITRGFLVKKDNSARSLELVDTPGTAPGPRTSGRAEDEIGRRIKQLEADPSPGSDQAIETLRQALQILGYDQSDQI